VWNPKRKEENFKKFGFLKKWSNIFKKGTIGKLMKNTARSYKKIMKKTSHLVNFLHFKTWFFCPQKTEKQI